MSIVTIRENIILNLKSTLEAITTAHGYANTIASVQRWNQRGAIFSAFPTIIINTGPEDKKPEPHPLMTCSLKVYIDIWTNQPEDGTKSSDEILNSLLGDVEKALAADITRGGYAIDTNITGNLPFETVQGQPQIGISIEIEVAYQHSQTDPAVSG